MKVIVGMSGGVDSSVSALLLKQQGLEVEGLFMKNWEEDDTSTYCSAAKDLADARSVCETLDIPLKTVNLSAEYWENVFERFLKDHETGYTPNPDILCNREIKFKAFLEHALDLGADKIATGHYARIRETEYAFELLKGSDPNKDQSYFLYTLGQAQLAQSIFPVGNLIKTSVRDLAAEVGLITQGKKDSTGICFIGERPFREFLARYLPAKPGLIKNIDDGLVVGEHQGVMYYTIGQRQGLGIGGVKGKEEEPWFVISKDVSRNELLVGQGHDHPALFREKLVATELSWVSDKLLEAPYACKAKIRYRQADQECFIETIDNNTATIRFIRPQRAVTPGQSIVFYVDEVCLGGGVISSSTN